MIKRNLSYLGLASGMMLSANVHAISTDGHFGNYGTISGVLEVGDSRRDSELGYGGVIGFGMPLPREAEALEFTIKLLERDRDAGGASDEQRSIFVHWVRDIGGSWIGNAKPFVLFGAGAVQEDVLGDDHIHAGLDGGLGALFPVGQRGWAIRTQASALAQINDESVPDEDFLIDFHVQLGLQVPFGARADTRSSASAGAPPEYPPEVICENRIVDPVTGRAECINDSDRDGVSDGKDQCPGTPAGTAVDTKGCTVQGVVDSDGDGVLDEVDACPESPVGMQIDATGCLISQTVTLKAIQFPSGSAQLTGDARAALDQVARTLKSQPNLDVQITGHTDSQGNDNFNLVLSQQRAESVRQRLIRKGVEPGRLQAVGQGETLPVADNETDAGRRENRRVEFKVEVR